MAIDAALLPPTRLIHLYRTEGVAYRLAARSVTCDNAQLSEPCSHWPVAASVHGQWSLTGHNNALP